MFKIQIKNLCFLSCLLLAAGCNTNQPQLISDQIQSMAELNQPILIITPISSEPNFKEICANLGENLHFELSKIANTKIIYSKNIESLQSLVKWENLITNGELNSKELAAMGKAIQCSSVLACRVLEVSQYPPQRMILQFVWVESETQRQICSLTEDINLMNKEINKRYGEFNYGKKLTFPTKFNTKKLEIVKQAAALSTKDFRRFVATYSLESLLSKVSEYN